MAALAFYFSDALPAWHRRESTGGLRLSLAGWWHEVAVKSRRRAREASSGARDDPDDVGRLRDRRVARGPVGATVDDDDAVGVPGLVEQGTHRVGRG